ncbi:hypothetical protein V1264_016181 [Littorina saxatilis]|uniref:SEC7 domain-containing protein n=1 Tax=Littorina saxatilis TaxID=31220 RepID=A0AAN9GHU3_9CAEN
MEDTLKQLAREIITPKFAAIKHSCSTALNVLQSEEAVQATEAWKLRELCLEPLQMALESRAKKLSYHALAGIQHMIKDERFHSSLETGEEEHWLPVQVLNTLHMTPQLPEDIQVDVMKLLLNMMLTTTWCMNAGIVIKISQLFVKCYAHSPKSKTGRSAAAMSRESLGEWCSLALGSASSSDTIRSLLADLARNQSSDENGNEDDKSEEDEGSNDKVEDGDDMLADFKPSAAGPGSVENAMEEVVALLKYLVDRLESVQSSNQGRQTLPLLLEGVHAILSKMPSLVRHNAAFQDLIWKQLCPVLISLLGVPKVHEKGEREKDGSGRGPAFMASSNALGSATKIIYSISAELMRLLGSVKSLRPVLESLFHRILLYPPPQQRLEALKVIKELLSDPERIVDMAVPVDEKNSNKPDITDMGFIKLIMEAVQEGSHCNDVNVCFTSIKCVDNLLRSLDTLCRGEVISESIVDDILAACSKLEKGQTPHNLYITPEESSRGGQQDGDGGSVSVSSGAQLSSLSPPDSPRPVVDSDTNSESSVPDAIKRVTRLRLSDIEADETTTQTSETILPDSKEEDTAQGETTESSGENTSDGKDAATDSKEEKNCPSAESTDGTAKRENMEQQFSPARKALREESERVERQNAAEFVGLLHSCAPQLLTLPFVTEVDEALQTFASNFCAGLAQQQTLAGKSEMSGLVLNADGVYTASLSALKLTYALSKSGFYTTRQHHLLPQSQVQFVDSVLGSGLLLYLSPTWLSELYQQTIASPLMDVTHLTIADCALLQMLEDIDGLGSHETGGQMMFEFRECEEGVAPEETPEMSLKIEAGQTLARCILLTCWDSILDVLSVLLDGKSSCGITFSLGLLLGTEGAREETQRGRDTICLSLNGLQTASRLCCMLGLQSKCGSAFAQLANTSCVREDLRAAAAGTGEGKGPLKVPGLRDRLRAVRLHAAHVLSMDVMMITGLEVGSHAADCWKHVFRCCAHISELEHTYFSRGNHESSLPRVHQGRAVDTEGAVDAEGFLEMDSMMMTGAPMPVAPRINVAELIRQSCIECGWDTSLTGGGVLTPQQAARALCGLSQEVDSLFENAAKKLNLKALLSFLTELGEASRQQLRYLQHHHGDPADTSNMLTPGNPATQPGQGSRLPTNALHLYRLQQALMTVVHSPRPLLHLVRVWAAASPYLVEATGHHDHSVSKMSVTCIHDFIVAVLANRHELPHFHINEFLCKTFEDMLCLELCDSDVQDQIVCSICELVEACTQELQSGWRPLFGALRSVRIEYTANEKVNEERQRHVAAVLDVFEVYLNTDNILVFANATVDCILCLLKYVHGSGMFEDMDDDDDGSDSGSDVATGGVNLQNLCVPALGYLARCSHILASMWKMPACPVFKGAFRIQLGSQVRTVDPHIPHLDVPLVFESFLPKGSKSGETSTAKGDNAADSLSITSVDSGMLEGAFTETDKKKDKYNWLQTEYTTLADLDKGSGVLHVWYLLLDGLATAISSCPKSFQPQTLTTLFQLLRETAVVPGVKFSLYCVNHLLLPMLQSWLRRGSRLHGYWDTGALNFKQCCGLTADLVVEFIGKFVGQTEEVSSLELMLKQLFAVLTECVAQPIENLSLLGCSCIRHVMLTAGPILTESMWGISARCLAHSVSVTTHNLRLLMSLFHPNSDNFYGDIGQVKVATRKDCVAMDNMRLKQLARQVFLLESQVTSMPQLQYDLEEDKSFVFLVYPPDHADSLNPDHISARVPLRDMVVSLLSNQLLLQTLGSLLLDTNTDMHHASAKYLLPGMMGYMSTRNILAFMDILESLYQFALDFDIRPGLKFLLQKVAGLEVAANQYRLAGASMVLYLHALTHLCSRLEHLDMDSVRELIAREKKEEEERKRKAEEGDGCERRGESGEETVKKEGELRDAKKSESGSSTGGGGDGKAPSTDNQEKIKASGKISTEKQSANTQHKPPPSSNPVPQPIDNPTTTTNTATDPSSQSQSSQPSLPLWKQRGLASTSKPWDCTDVFLPMLQEKCDAICQQYVDILSESHTESLVDRMSGRPLFFLLAQPEDINEITHPLLRKSSNADKKGEKRGGVEGSKEGESSAPIGTVVSSPLAEAEEETAVPHSPVSPTESTPSDASHHGNKDLSRQNSEDSDRQCSKRQMRADHESKVYSVATDTVIQNLIGQYKRHKMHNTMPNTQVQFARHHRPHPPKVKVPRKEPVDDAIDKQQQSSIMKDSEARQRSWSEMLVTVLRLFLQLSDPQFQAMLPVVSPSITQLICHAQDPVLRDTLAQWFQRLGRMYNFMPTIEGKGSEGVGASNKS